MQERQNFKAPFDYSKLLATMNKGCNHDYIYLRSCKHCRGEAELCSKKCSENLPNSGHSLQKHQVIQTKDLQVKVKTQKDRKAQIERKYLDELESAYKQQQQKLYKFYQQAQVKIRQASYQSQYDGLISIVQTKRFSKLQCWQVFLLDKLEVDREANKKAQQIIQNFSKSFNGKDDKSAQKSTQIQQKLQKQIEECAEKKFNTAMHNFLKQYKGKVEEQRIKYKKKQNELQQRCKILQNELQQTRKKYQKNNDTEPKSSNSTNKAQSSQKIDAPKQHKLSSNIFAVKLNNFTEINNKQPKKMDHIKFTTLLNSNLPQELKQKQKKNIQVDPELRNRIKQKIQQKPTNIFTFFKKDEANSQSQSQMQDEASSAKKPSIFDQAMNSIDDSINKFNTLSGSKQSQNRFIVQPKVSLGSQTVKASTGKTEMSFVPLQKNNIYSFSHRSKVQQFGLDDEQQQYKLGKNEQQQYIPVISKDQQQMQEHSNISFGNGQQNFYYKSFKKPQQHNTNLKLPEKRE